MKRSSTFTHVHVIPIGLSVNVSVGSEDETTYTVATFDFSEMDEMVDVVAVAEVKHFVAALSGQTASSIDINLHSAHETYEVAS